MVAIRWKQGVSFFCFYCLSMCGLVNASSFIVEPKDSSIEVKAVATGSEFAGKLKEFKVEDATGNSKTLEPSKFKLVWDFKDLTTDDEVRDANMREWLNHNKYPQGSFTLEKWEVDKESKSGKCIGVLEINGKKVDVDFPVKIEKKGKDLLVTGECKIDYTKFDLPIIRRLLLLTVEPDVKIIFSLKGTVK